jgi:cytosine/adenosine deaminase-related metal-dependent hydrolase
MAAAFQAARLQAFEQGTPTVGTRDILRFATIDGARSIGLEGEVGSLTPGKQADIVLLRVPPLAVLNDPVGYVTLGAHAGMVDSVIVAGRVKKRAGRLCGFNLERCSAALAATSQRIIERAGFMPPVAALR